MRSSRPDPVNPDSGAEQPARLFHPMFVALPVAVFVVEVADRVLAGNQADEALFEIHPRARSVQARPQRTDDDNPVLRTRADLSIHDET